MASLASGRKLHQLQGGYECIFVSDPPDVLQTECPICLCVLREPYLVDCCGNSFCKSCIKRVKSDRRPCPLCNVQFTTTIPDKRLQRTLNELRVYCCHKEAGCEWVGELAGLTPHLNLGLQVDLGNRFSGCQLAKLACKFCGDDFQRKELLKHEGDECTQRPYSCEYCENFEATFYDVTLNHWPTCPSRPVPCPNECGISPELKFLEHHVDDECPMKMVECAFKYAGCKETFLRKDMGDHMNQNLAGHMSLQAASHQQELKKLNHRISELEIQLAKAKAENKTLMKQVEQDCRAQVAAASREVKKAQDLRLKGHLSTLRGEIKKAQDETKDQIIRELGAVREPHSRVVLVPVSFTMTGFQQKKVSNSSWYSPWFYTHPRGYKMCLRVDANGYGVRKNSHISVYLYMMRGEYDDSLRWPFQGDITVQLLNQVGGSEHHEVAVHFIDSADNEFCKRVLSGERSATGRGFHDFICHSNLLPSYLKDDCLKLCIKEVKLNLHH